MRPTAVLFDLDGTLTDPMEGITKSVQHALRRQGIDVRDRRSLCRFIGPPLYESFRRYYAMDDAQALRAVSDYREVFAVSGLYDNTMYPGIPLLLKALREAGTPVALATLKPAVFAERILAHFGLRDSFVAVAGSALHERHVTKAEIIAAALESLPAAVRGGAVMVGDRDADVAGAHDNGLPCIGVLYGYGVPEELACADRTAHTVEQLSRILLDEF